MAAKRKTKNLADALIARAKTKSIGKMPPVAARAEIAKILRHNDAHENNYERVGMNDTIAMLRDEFGFTCNKDKLEKIVRVWFGRGWSHK